MLKEPTERQVRIAHGRAIEEARRLVDAGHAEEAVRDLALSLAALRQYEAAFASDSMLPLLGPVWRWEATLDSAYDDCAREARRILEGHSDPTGGQS